MAGAPNTVDIGAVIGDAWGVVLRNLPPFVVLALAAEAIPQIALVYGPQYRPSVAGYLVASLVHLLIGLPTLAFARGAIIYASICDLEGRPAPISKWLSAGLRNWLWLVGLGVLSGLAYGAGLILLIVPGVLLMLSWMVAAPAVVVEGKGILPAIGRSSTLTVPLYRSIFLLWLIYAVASPGLSLLANLTLYLVPATSQRIVLVLLRMTLSTFVFLCATTITTALFRRLRGDTRERLAEIFA